MNFFAKDLRMLHSRFRPITLFEQTRNILTMKEVKNRLADMARPPVYYGGSVELPEYNITHQSELPKRRMRDSYDEGVIPLKDDKKMRLKYTTHMNTVRFGRILEDLDKFAVWLCVLHTRNPDDPNWKLPFAIVTAQVDRIDVSRNDVRADADINLSGMVTWVGYSSMEATVRVEQDSTEMLEAKFVLATRQLTRQKSAVVNGLVLETEEEKRLFKMGEEVRLKRKAEADSSLLKVIPQGHEVEDIHRMFLETVDPSSATFRTRVKPEGSVWMEDTMLKSVVMNHPQEANVYNKIFGGFLMRKSYELAWMNALTFCGQRPDIQAVDDIHFRCPVPIGSLLFLSSQVGYTQDTRMQVKVHAEVVNPQTSTRQTTNIFHFTFGAAKEVPTVIPKSYAEAMMYIDARRHFRG